MGSNGSCSDAQVFNKCQIKLSIVSETIGFPDPDPFPRDYRDTPYFSVAYDNFALRTWSMKPFLERNLTSEECFFNYSQSKQDRWWRMLWGPGQLFQMPTDHNDTRATQCHICASSLSDFAQHYMDTLQGKLSRTSR